MLVLRNSIILDGHKTMKPVSGKAIIVDDEKIQDIIDEKDIPEGAKALDLGGQYLLPGLINAHVHIPSSGKPSKKKTDYKKLAALLRYKPVRFVIAKMCENYAKQQLLAGTTTIRAVGGVLDFDTQLRDKINSGETIGPRILAANQAIGVPGGHMDGSVAVAVNSVEEAVEMVHRLDKEKVDLIKLMITGGVLDAEVPGEPGDLKMPAEYVKAVCSEAHKLGYQVAAHVEGNEGMVVALENGVDTIEHGGKVSDEVIELFKKTGAKLICTLSPTIPFAKLSQEVTGFSDLDVLNGTALYKYMCELYNICLDKQIPVGLGTDTGCPFVTHYDMWRELDYFCDVCDVSPKLAIHSATLLNAQILGIDNEVGSIEPGKSADFMVVKDNPLENVSALRSPTHVFFRGNEVDISKLKKFDIVEQALK